MILCLRSPSYTDEVKRDHVAKHMKHLDMAKQAREYLADCIESAKTAAQGHHITELSHHVPLSGPSEAHYSFDFAQQVTLLLLALTPNTILLTCFKYYCCC